MQTFILALSRLVPLSFLVALTLVGSRYLHDLVLRSHPRLARWAFAVVSAVGLIAIVPYTIRAGLVVAARKDAATSAAPSPSTRARRAGRRTSSPASTTACGLA